jgi:hypothetical protein
LVELFFREGREGRGEGVDILIVERVVEGGFYRVWDTVTAT